jgi:hypothetical protein
MAYEHKPGQGTLGKAKEKKKETSPDLTGKIKLPDGTECWLSGWVKKGANGGEFYSLQIGQPVQPVGEVYSMAHQPFPSQHEKAKANGYQPQPAGLDDDVPF